ncbi:MAG: metal-dependent hydrolase [Parcubacteria group bacterium]|nr:metal-dependent hydrolase [Parcubacteria group bacterium]
MDIFSHAFWTAVSARGANSKIRYLREFKPLKVVWATVWGVAPDVFAFAPLFVSLILGLFLGIGDLRWDNLPRPTDTEPFGPPDSLAIFRLTNILYSISHSLVTFAIVFVTVWFLSRRVKWEMLGWLLHILIDVPTHSYRFYPTPVFWPLAAWKFDGISWGTPWFFVLNLAAVALVSIWLMVKHYRSRK